MGEYLVHAADGFRGFGDMVTGKGQDGFQTFINSPAPLVFAAAVAIFWLTRKRR